MNRTYTAERERERFEAYALTFLNIPYYWGGDDPILGFDCSGITQDLYQWLGLDPQGDQTAQGLFDHFVKPENGAVVPVADLATLCFYGRSIREIVHVGVALDGFRMIEAGGGGRDTKDLKTAAKRNAFVKVRNIRRRPDLIAMVAPHGLPWEQQT